MARDLGALATHEPGATELGRALRALVLDPDRPGPVPRAEALVMAADRAQHVDEVIAPALAEGRWVVTDRFSGSTLAYQGWGRGLSTDSLRQVVAWAAGGHRGGPLGPGRRAGRRGPPAARRRRRPTGSSAWTPTSTSGSATGSSPWPGPIPTTGPSSTARPGSTRWRPPSPPRWPSGWGRCPGGCGDPGARRERPVAALFAEVVGQPRAVQALRAAARDPVHAYLFCGADGPGHPGRRPGLRRRAVVPRRGAAGTAPPATGPWPGPTRTW